MTFSLNKTQNKTNFILLTTVIASASPIPALVAKVFPFPCVNVSYVYVRVNGPHLFEVFRSHYTTDSPPIRQSIGGGRSFFKNYLDSKIFKLPLTLSL